jgi:hypothetical protein
MNTTSTPEGPIDNRALAAEMRQLAAKLEASASPVDEQIAMALQEARRAKIMAAVALAIVLAWTALVLVNILS